MSGSCVDLSEYEENADVQDAFSALVSGGKPGYKTVIEKRTDTPKCHKCSIPLSGSENFCPECGEKLK